MSLSLTSTMAQQFQIVSVGRGGISIPAEFTTPLPHGAKLKGGLALPAGRARVRSWAQLVLV